MIFQRENLAHDVNRVISIVHRLRMFAFDNFAFVLIVKMQKELAYRRSS